MTLNPQQVSNNFLRRAFEDGTYVSPMKLQKILYFFAAEYERNTGVRAFAEPFMAWEYGPVLCSVYYEFKPYRQRRISTYAKDAQGKAFMVDEGADENFTNTVDRVWEATKRLGAVDLSRITHLPGSAWHRAFTNGHDAIDPNTVAKDATYRNVLHL